VTRVKNWDADDSYPLANRMALALALTHGNLVP